MIMTKEALHVQFGDSFKNEGNIENKEKSSSPQHQLPVLHECNDDSSGRRSQSRSRRRRKRRHEQVIPLAQATVTTSNCSSDCRSRETLQHVAQHHHNESSRCNNSVCYKNSTASCLVGVKRHEEGEEALIQSSTSCYQSHNKETNYQKEGRGKEVQKWRVTRNKSLGKNQYSFISSGTNLLLHPLRSLPIYILVILTLQTATTCTDYCCRAFTISNTQRTTSTTGQFHIYPYSSLQASTKSSSDEITTIQAVQPMQSSTQERRRSVQRAWEEQAQLLNLDADVSAAAATDTNMNHNDNNDIQSSSISATPFLDLFSDAGIASVQKVQTSSASSSSSSTASSLAVESSMKKLKPKGRPASVPGAMSRATLMEINEMENRVRARGSRMNKNVNSIPRSSNHKIYGNNVVRNGEQNKSTNKSIMENNKNPDLLSENKFPTAAAISLSSPFDQQNNDDNIAKQQKQNQIKMPSTAVSSSHSKMLVNNNVKETKKKRGRGRPRKNGGNVASVDEMTSIAATLTSTQNSSNSGTNTKKVRNDKPYSNDKVKTDSNSDENTSSRRRRRGELKTLRPKSKKLKENEKEGQTTGMMQTGKNGKGKDGEPPNLQRYYRTELLTPQEEYTLGMKIQFMINCEQVHDGLHIDLGRNPTITEWANACGFIEEDESRNDSNYLQSDYVNQIRPLKSDNIDPVEDPNMFVGNGLVNASGPGRGRGRAKKLPPSYLDAYYDDSHIKFEKDFKEKEKSLNPLNRGTPFHFVELMVTAKEAKQRMVQCNMRLVVSISKRYKHVGVNIADLVQEGSIGLARAAEKFDPKKGFKFSTYASWWIQQAVFRSIAYHSRTIRLPVHVHNLLNRTRRVRLELQRILGRAPTNEEMAAELDMSIEKYSKMVRLTRKAISLDIAKYQNNPKDIGQESETSLGDTIDASDVIKDESSPEQNVDRVLFRDDLKEMLKILGEDEKAVIYARYGIDDGLTRTVTTVAAQMGQSKSWVRSQECRALRKLRRPWYEKRLWQHQNSLTG